jgi:hypothetical protein
MVCVHSGAARHGVKAVMGRQEKDGGDSVSEVTIVCLLSSRMPRHLSGTRLPGSQFLPLGSLQEG